jgi:hypothetical protein
MYNEQFGNDKQFFGPMNPNSSSLYPRGTHMWGGLSRLNDG